MKWQLVSVSLLLSLLVTAGAIVVQWRNTQQTGGLFNHPPGDKSLQMGYYDMLSRQRELYDTHFTPLGETVLMRLTSPNDNRFVVRLQLRETKRSAQGVAFSYTRLSYADGGETRMIKNILDWTEQHGAVFDKLTTDDEELIITPSGQILSMN